MGLRERVMELVRAGDVSALESLSAAEPRSVRYLMGRLWDVSAEHRQTAGRALGAIAASHPDLGREIMRRVVWGLNDESATNGVYGVPAFGEIAARAPEVAAGFVGPVASYLWDDGLRPAILEALDKVATHRPEILEPAVDHLAKLVDPEDRRQARRILDRVRQSKKEETNGT